MKNYDIDRRLGFSRIDEKTKKYLKESWLFINPELPGILTAFYQHLSSEPSIAKILGSQTERLKGLQTQHWQRLFSGNFDLEYMNGVYTVGMVHKRIGLEPRWYIAGYSYVQCLIINAVVKRFRGKREHLAELLCATTKAILFDIDLAITAYHDALEEEKQVVLGSVVDTFGIALDRLKQGDLDYLIQTEVSGVFIKMKTDLESTIERLRDTIKRILQGSIEVQTSAQEIAQAATDLSSRTIQQATNIQETAAQAVEITRLVKKTANNSSEMATLVASVKISSGIGETVAEEASRMMTKIQESSGAISEIVEVIENIASQTNLLSMNAAIEAAHAGQAGKGFEVVAGEVRKLANEAKESAMKINTLIKNSLEITAMGAKLVKESGEKFKQVVQEVSAIAALVTGISQASYEQAQGVEQINIAVNEMSTMTNENSAMVQETLAAAQSMERLSVKQTQVLSFFKVQ